MLTVPHIRSEKIVTNNYLVVLRESFPAPPTGYFEVLCWECDAAWDADFRVLMDNTVLVSRGLVVFPDESIWRCDSCGHLVYPGNENTDAYLYVEEEV